MQTYWGGTGPPRVQNEIFRQRRMPLCGTSAGLCMAKAIRGPGSPQTLLFPARIMHQLPTSDPSAFSTAPTFKTGANTWLHAQTFDRKGFLQCQHDSIWAPQGALDVKVAPLHWHLYIGTCQCRRCKRHGFDLWVGKIPWRRNATQSSILA